MANTVVYNKHSYVTKLRERLDLPTCWKDIMNVTYTNDRTFVKGVITSEPSVVGGTRGTAYNYEDFTIAAQTGTINQMYQIPIFIDEADRYQQTYFDQMEIAAFQGKKINEKLESLLLASHASWVDFGATDLANTGDDDATQITVSAANIDDLMRGIKRKIYSNNGVDVAAENGIFIVWRASDWLLLEGFAQASGYTEADLALKNGIPVQKAFYYGGINHYLSNSHTANHLFAGVRKTGKDLGILRGTYGQAKFIEDPAKLSGLGIVSRLDHGFLWPTDSTPSTQRLQEMNMDVNVS